MPSQIRLLEFTLEEHSYNFRRCQENEMLPSKNLPLETFPYDDLYFTTQLIDSLPRYRGCPGGLDWKESAWNAGDMGSVPGLGRSPGGGNGYLFQYFSLENPVDRGAW